MQSLADYIAGNHWLHAISIIVGIAALPFFLFKNLPPAIRFIYLVFRRGIRRSLLAQGKRAFKLARRDFHDVRLVLIRAVQYSSQILLRFILLPLLAMIELLLINLVKMEPQAINFDARNLITFSIIFPFGVAMTWFQFRPLVEFSFYLRTCRRLVQRTLRGTRKP